MSRDLSLYLDDILVSIDKIQRYTANLMRSEFIADERTFDAVIRNLEIIGEAVKNIPPTVRDLYPQIKWRKIAGLRDILVHAYFSVDDEILWDIIQNKLSELHDCITTMKADL